MKSQVAARVGHDFSRMPVTAGGDRAESEAEAAAIGGSGESRAGRYGLDDVRIHTEAGAAERARALDARAFSEGSDIYFDSGRYRPETAEGSSLLTHELAHVAQSGQSPGGHAGVHRDGNDKPPKVGGWTFNPTWQKPGTNYWGLPGNEKPWGDVNDPLGTKAAVAKVVQKQQQQVHAWLDKNFSKNFVLPVDQAVDKIREQVKDAQSMSDAEIGNQVQSWGQEKGIAIPGPSGAKKPQPVQSPLEKLRAEVESIIPDGKPDVVQDGVNFKIKAGGPQLTAKSKGSAPDTYAKLNSTWSGTVTFTSAYKGMTFATSMSTDEWSVSLSYPFETIEPNILGLKQLFGDAYSALGDVRRKVAGFHNLSDVSAIHEATKVDVEKLSNAFDAFKGAATIRPPGGFTFGVKVFGPVGSDSPVPGVGAMATVTFFF